MAPKRNDPCPCGSGKKYKHCCMRANRAKAQKTTTQPQLEPTVSPVTEPVVRDPEIERLNALYKVFQSADYAEQKAILRNAIEEKTLDGELTFEFFNSLHGDMVEHEEQEEFNDLIHLLKSTLPEIYAAENQWFWEWEIHSALAADDEAALQAATNQLITNGEQGIDQFFPTFECLLYHGRRAVLHKALQSHSFELSRDDDLLAVEDEVDQTFYNFLVIDYIGEHVGDALLAEKNLEALNNALAPYAAAIVQADLTNFIARAGGLKSGEWTEADFVFSATDQADDDDEQDPAVDRLVNLSFEFLHYATRCEEIPITKAELARGNLVIYLTERQVGTLSTESNQRSQKQNRSRKAVKKKAAEPTHILLPDHRTLDRFLSRFYGFMATGVYKGAAFFELLPTWVRFLQSRALVTETEGQAALTSLQALHQSMVKIMERHRSDPKLAENMRQLGEQFVG